MAKFISKYTNHKLCMKPSWMENVQGVIIKHPAKHVEFNSQGVFDTEDKEVIKFLTKHAEFGINIFEEKEESKKEQAPE